VPARPALDPVAERVAALFGGASVADLELWTVRHVRLVVHRAHAQRMGLNIPACVLERVAEVIHDKADAR
jgi:hypothetical protein